MRNRFKKFVLRNNERGRLLWVHPLYAACHGLRHYPVRRFLRLARYFVLVTFGPYRPLTLAAGLKTSVFYLCVRTGSDGRSVIVKIPRLDNRHAHSFTRAIRRRPDFDGYVSLLKSLGRDRLLAKHLPEAHSVRRDGGYESDLVEGTNLATLRDQIRAKRSLPEGHTASDLLAAIDELLRTLEKQRRRASDAVGDWALHNLIYDPSDRCIKNVDLEGFFTYQGQRLEATSDFVAAELNTLRHLVTLTTASTPGAERVLKALSALGDAASSNLSYSGRAYSSGYHSITLDGLYFRGQRECADRLARVPYDFEGKTVLDLGCNNGGMLHCLSDRILEGIGLDHDPKCVNAAHLVQEVNGSQNLAFYSFDLDRPELRLLDNFLLDRRVDIIFLLSVCMWLQKPDRIIQWASETAPTLLFETNGSDLLQGEQLELARKSYQRIVLVSPNSPDDPGQQKRALYLCYRTDRL